MIKRGLISFILMIALALVGFGHRSLAPAADAQATAYVLAGGDWSDICGQSGDPRHAQADQCLACVISHSCVTPEPAYAPALTITAATIWAAPAHRIYRLSSLDWSYPARAPPLA